jgi:hypothetical protein
MRASLYHAIDEALEDRVQGVQSFMERQIASLSIPEIRDEFREHSVLGSAKVVYANLQIFADYTRYIFDLITFFK